MMMLALLLDKGYEACKHLTAFGLINKKYEGKPVDRIQVNHSDKAFIILVFCFLRSRAWDAQTQQYTL
jgi:hypothetical protein